MKSCRGTLQQSTCGVLPSSTAAMWPTETNTVHSKHYCTPSQCATGVTRISDWGSCGITPLNLFCRLRPDGTKTEYWRADSWHGVLGEGASWIVTLTMKQAKPTQPWVSSAATSISATLKSKTTLINHLSIQSLNTVEQFGIYTRLQKLLGSSQSSDEQQDTLSTDITETASVSAMIAKLNWQTLAERWRIARVQLFHKIHYQYVAISIPLSQKQHSQPTRSENILA